VPAGAHTAAPLVIDALENALLKAAVVAAALLPVGSAPKSSTLKHPRPKFIVGGSVAAD
jgi:hypothetical protein